MGSYIFDPKELTKEKKLWDVYIASRRIPHSKFNTVTTVIVFILLVANAWFTSQTTSETAETIRKLSDTGLIISLTTIGLLLAGFTVFATISQPGLSLRMAEITHPDSGLSYLKHNYFIFLRVFIFYIVFAVLCLLVVIFGHKGGLLSFFVTLSPYPECVKFLAVKIAYVVLMTSYYFLIMQLKSFVFNVYHAVMTSLRWKAEGYE